MNKDKLKTELTRDEALRLKPYRDSVGKLSIGVGRNLDDKGISAEEAEVLLDNDIDEHMALLDKYCPWWRALDEVRQRALLNMAFNLGVGPSEEQPKGKLLQFKNTLSAMERADWEAAANGMSASAWAQQVGVRATRLIEMMRAGGDS